jgi:peptidoglycan/LPS O-acetylase OafA/YrhL
MQNTDTDTAIQPERSSGKSVRLHHLDWLRVIGTILIFVFHSAQPFNPGFDWEIQNAERSPLIGWLVTAMRSWPMPFFMLLAGAGAWFALRRRSNRQYVGERFTRLFLPLFFGIFLLIIPQIYLVRVQRGQFQGSFLQFLPHSFEGGPYPVGNFSWGHLWFLAYLFVYALVTLPLFRFLQRDTGRRWISRLAAFCQRRGAIFFLAIPIIFGQVALGWRFPETHALIGDWMWHWVLLFVFVFGYVLFSDERFQQAIDREWKLALVLAVASSVGTVVLRRLGLDLTRDQPLYWTHYVLSGIVLRLGTWTWLILLLGLGSKFLRFKNEFLEYASPASYPIYVLHQTIIIIVAFYVVQWNSSILLKYLVIVLVSFAATMLLYEIARRWGVMRFLFGLKRRRVR